MLKPIVECVDGDFTNLLEVIVRVGGHQLPAGTTSWGIIAVRRDERTGSPGPHGGWFCPGPGNWAEAKGPIDSSNGRSWPSHPGDGLRLATTEIDDLSPLWEAVTMDGIPCDHLVLVAYDGKDVLGYDSLDYINTGVRVRRLAVVADVDGTELLKRHGTGAHLPGFQLSGWPQEAIFAVMWGATWEESQAAVRDGIASPGYTWARAAGASDQQVRLALAAGIPLRLYSDCLARGAHHEGILAASAAGIDLLLYREACRVGASHDEIMTIWRADVSLNDYIDARAHQVSHDRFRAALKARIDWAGYDVARRAGASDRRVRRADRMNIALHDYARARRAGGSDREVLAAHLAGVCLRAYAAAREAGLTDAEVHIAHQAGADLYQCARERWDRRYASGAFIDEPPF
ncbi:hypothetical protein [Nonomuraea sp. NPDC049400]|uniref:hypothetical protein n=1 Tax=Nonomuraea sp. NPDC049400 TaxID=3364352 RepID=UPI0037B28D1A